MAKLVADTGITDIPSPRDTPEAAAHWNLLSREKWYYILYNAIIHQETLCKDILLV